MRPLPESYKTYTVVEAKNVLESILNGQVKHSPSDVFVGDKFFKVTYDGHHTHMVNYADLGKMVIYEYPNYFNVVMYNKKGREVNKVVTKDLEQCHDLLSAIKIMQKTNIGN